MKVKDSVKMRAEWTITKFRDPNDKIADLLRTGAKVGDIITKFPAAFLGKEVFPGNIALHEGLYLLTGIISGIDTSSDKWDSTHAYLGVGDSATAEADEQTGLQAASNKTWKAMDGTYPQRASAETAEDQYVEWRATFGSGDANYSWQEYTVVNASSDTGKNLNRKTTDKGTKASGEFFYIV